MVGVSYNVCKFSGLLWLILSNCQKPIKDEILSLDGFWQFDFGNQAVEWKFSGDSNTHFI